MFIYIIKRGAADCSFPFNYIKLLELFAVLVKLCVYLLGKRSFPAGGICRETFSEPFTVYYVTMAVVGLITLKYYRLLTWIRDFFFWLSEGKSVFMGILVLSVAAILVFGLWCNEFSIRLLGCVFQAFGMIFTIMNLKSVKDHFNHPTLLQLFINWWKRAPRWKDSEIKDISASGEFGVSGNNQILKYGRRIIQNIHLKNGSMEL